MIRTFPRRRALLAASMPLGLGGCTATDLANLLTSSGGVTRESGLAYGPDEAHRYDLYRPEGLPAEAPLVIFVYGGGWRSGRRGDYSFVARPLARMGCLVAVPDYRLWPTARFPGFVEDTALAVRALKAREAGRRLVVMGHSAGAFNAACVALDPRWGAQSAVSGFIGLAGPYDFGSHEVDPPEIFSGLSRIQAAPESLQAGMTPPMLLLHGAADTTVGPYHSRIMAERAREASLPVRHVSYPGMGHVGVLAALAPAARSLGIADFPVQDEVMRFLASPAGAAS